MSSGDVGNIVDPLKFQARFSKWDKKSEYVVKVTLEKYGAAIKSLKDLLSQIQVNYRGRLEALNYNEFSKALIRDFQGILDNLASSKKVTSDVIQAVKDSMDGDQFK